MLQATTQQTFGSCWSVTSNAIVWGLGLVCQDHNEVIMKQEVALLAVHCMSSSTINVCCKISLCGDNALYILLQFYPLVHTAVQCKSITMV